MKNAHGELVINNLRRALLAEEKQGFTNTGVLGGFNVFLLGIIPRVNQLFPVENIEVLKKLAQNYSNWSPLKRKEAFSELSRFMQEMTLLIQGIPMETIPTIIESTMSNSLDLCKKQVFNKKNEQEIAGVEKIKSIQTKNNLDVPQSPIQRTSKKTNDVSQRTNSLQYIKGVGPERARQLKKNGIHNVRELLLYYPRRYEDRRKRSIAELVDGEVATIKGKVLAGNVTNGKIKVVKLSIEQEGRIFHATWFNQTAILRNYPVNTEVVVTGKVRWQQQVPEVLVSDIEKVSANNLDTDQIIDSQTITPVYPESGRLTSKVIRSIIKNILYKVDTEFQEIIPQEEMGDWMGRTQAYREIHFPSNYSNLKLARERLVCEEILFLQLAVARLRQGIEQLESPPMVGGEDQLLSLYTALPFNLTKAQQRVIQEIFRDMAKPHGMARMVQGDVGSGKTAVAMAALLRAVGSGYQGAMMAPTEILAVQHFQSLEKVFTPLGVTVVCLLGGQSKHLRDDILGKIADGRAQIVVGTHALIQETVVFNALGLAVTDEQHRFGVRQRTTLQSKGISPHVLVLTATPIPRTLALTLYGDLQLSVLDEMPIGRKPIITRKLSEQARPKMEVFLEQQINQGRQIYVVCPLVEESETLDLISATQRASDLEVQFPSRRVALLHGRMKGVEKEMIMSAFNAGEIDILVATTVVEVGVNVPNASVMVIESAERFGLAQLHQLRGRVGRGCEQSYCFLLSDHKNSRRLDILCQTEDGFKIAEEDMRIRGTGELLGTRQHGLAELRLADLSQDGPLVEKAYSMAQKVLLNPEKFELLFQEVWKMFPPERIGVN